MSLFGRLARALGYYSLEELEARAVARANSEPRTDEGLAQPTERGQAFINETLVTPPTGWTSYFVSYHYQAGNGRTVFGDADVQLSQPLSSRADIQLLRADLQQRLNASVVLLHWRRYDDAAPGSKVGQEEPGPGPEPQPGRLRLITTRQPEP